MSPRARRGVSRPRAGARARRAGGARLLPLLAALAAALAPARAECAAGVGRPGREYFPNVALTSHEGKTLRFYDDLIAGKVVAINFIFTSCSAVCPGETARMREVQRLLGDRVGRDVFLYSISIDPETDTPEVLAEYAKRFHAGPGWSFLTGKKDEIDLLRRKLGMIAASGEPKLEDHATSLIVGNEASGQWMKRSSFDAPPVLARLLGGALHNWKVADGGRKADYAEAQRVDRSHGEMLYRSRCSSCHTLGGGDALGPDLLGISERRERAWLARWLEDPGALLEAKDPVALALFEKYDRIRMPDLGLTEVDVAALLDYLEEVGRLARRESAAAEDPHAHHHH